MNYTAAALHDEYMHLWNTSDYLPGWQRSAQKVAARLLSNLPRYKALEVVSNVPAAFIMCAHERESGGNWNTYLGNGQALNRVTTIVPKGRGPFKTFEEGALDAFALEKLGSGGIRLSDWDEAMLCFWMEKFNGFGYRQRGLRSPYLWGGTNHQQPGKYTSDNHFDPTFMDPQLGGMAVYGELVRQEPSLNLGGNAMDPAFLNRKIMIGDVLVQNGGIKQLQIALNMLGADPRLVEDGWIGRKTIDAFNAFGPKLKEMTT